MIFFCLNRDDVVECLSLLILLLMLVFFFINVFVWGIYVFGW